MNNKNVLIVLLFTIFFSINLYSLNIETKANGDAWNCEFIDSCETSGSSFGVFVLDTLAYVADDSAGLRIIDISDPTNINEIGNCNTYGYAQDVHVINTFAYIADGSGGFCIIDVSSPTNPAIIETLNIGTIYGLYVSGNYAYIADYYNGLRIIDITSSTNPQEIGSFYTGGQAQNVYVYDNYAYVATYSNGLRIIDVSDPTSPSEVGYISYNYTEDVFVLGNYAYIADASIGLRIVDVSDPTNPVEVGYYDGDSGYYEAHGVYVIGDYAYIGGWNSGLRIIYIADPTNPIEVGYYDTGGNSKNVFPYNDYVYVADVSNGLNVFKCNIMVLMSLNNGDTLNIGDEDTIKWISDTSIINQVEISYSIDNGNTWEIIDTIANTGEYVWTIPNLESDSCLFKVQSTDYDYVYAISSRVFSIKDLSGMEKKERILNNYISISSINNKNISIKYSMRDKTESRISIYDMSGRKIEENALRLEPGKNRINIGMRNGIYMIIIEDDKKVLLKKKVIVIE